MAEVVEKSNRGMRKSRTGTVVSKSGDKTVVVLVERRVRHPLYKKVVRKSKKHHAHDAENIAKVGDKVVITECRPISHMKRWLLKEVIGS